MFGMPDCQHPPCSPTTRAVDPKWVLKMRWRAMTRLRPPMICPELSWTYRICTVKGLWLVKLKLCQILVIGGSARFWHLNYIVCFLLYVFLCLILHVFSQFVMWFWQVLFFFLRCMSFLGFWSRNVKSLCQKRDTKHKDTFLTDTHTHTFPNRMMVRDGNASAFRCHFGIFMRKHMWTCAFPDCWWKHIPKLWKLE